MSGKALQKVLIADKVRRHIKKKKIRLDRDERISLYPDCSAQTVIRLVGDVMRELMEIVMAWVSHSAAKLNSRVV